MMHNDAVTIHHL